jgi:simple sugar transport system ATP-binding protein
MLNNQDLTGKSYHTFVNLGVRYVPASRMEEGLIPGLSLTEHFVLAGEQTKPFVDWAASEKTADERIVEFNIHGKPTTMVEDLSGGNQQRALLALLRTPLSLILMEHPTRGLDVESSIYIWSKLKERCRQGSAILFISADLDEILHYSDRILVFYSGKVSPPLNAMETTVDQLGQLIGGKGWPSAGSWQPAEAG